MGESLIDLGETLIDPGGTLLDWWMILLSSETTQFCTHNTNVLQEGRLAKGLNVEVR
jgi:hypothetical protein